VHAFPSLHVVPFGAAGFAHAPVDGLHVPAVWHESDAEHVTGFDPTHAPAVHASVCVQALPSLHVVPSAATGFEHTPVDGLHVPATWQASDAVHFTLVPAVHVPALHVSFESHLLPSLHEVPSGKR